MLRLASVPILSPSRYSLGTVFASDSVDLLVRSHAFFLRRAVRSHAGELDGEIVNAIAFVGSTQGLVFRVVLFVDHHACAARALSFVALLHEHDDGSI